MMKLETANRIKFVFLCLLFVITVLMLGCGKEKGENKPEGPKPESTVPAPRVDNLHWEAIPQEGAGGQAFPKHFRASLPNGWVIVSVLNKAAVTIAPDDGAGLEFVRQKIENLHWEPIQQTGAGGPTFPEHYKASVPDGCLILSLLTRPNDGAASLVLVSQQVNNLHWTPIQQTGAGGPAFPLHYKAAVSDGWIILSLLNRAQGDGVGLTLLKQQVNSLNWKIVQQTGAGGPAFPLHYQSPIPDGWLILSVLNRLNGSGTGLAFVQQQVNNLHWEKVQQTGAGGPTFPVHYKSSTAEGDFLLSVKNRRSGDGAALIFIKK